MQKCDWVFQIDDGLTPKIYHCGSELPQDFISDTRLAVVRFISDGSIRRSGFNLTYNLIEGKAIRRNLQRSYFCRQGIPKKRNKQIRFG